MTSVHIPFEHQQHAHCETGVTVNLLKHMGLEISEPLAFGLGSGLYFVHFPFIKIAGKPAVGYRRWFVNIFKKSVERLGGKVVIKSFRNPEKGMKFLDDMLEAGKPVALVTNVYYLNYLPRYFRFQFSGHNLIIYGKEGDEYLISDPVMEGIERISKEQLQRSRFAKTRPRPNGKLYFIENIAKPLSMERQIKQSIKETCYNMTAPPVPWVGCNGIQLMAKKIKAYPDKLDNETIALYLSNIIQMQEVIGTGGAGFRFMYAAFLQEVANLLDNQQFLVLSERMTKIGDDWRSFASEAGKIMKGRNLGKDRFEDLGNLLFEIGTKERQFFKDLKVTASSLR